jgi:peptidoglycan/xylan/chitin deacetylase (PgdA/CDA1 family)
VGAQKDDEGGSGVNPSSCFKRIAVIVLLISAAAVAQTQTTPARAVALTIDDLPLAVPGNDQAPGKLAEAQRVNGAILKALVAHHATAIGFVNEIKVNVANERDARAQILRDWLHAGMELGNHTYSHPFLSEVGESKYEDDFIRGTPITSVEMKAEGKTERYFRYPYLDTGKNKSERDAVIAFYTSRGFVNAPVTVQNQDWMFNAPYSDALAKRDAVAQQRIVDTYFQHTRDVLAHAEDLSRQSFRREIPQVMLLHVDALNADHLDAVLSIFEQRGYRFISLDEALQDAAFRTPDEYVGSDGISWLDRWQIALGRNFHPSEPEPPVWVQDEYRKLTGQAP